MCNETGNSSVFSRAGWYKAIEDCKYYPAYDDGCYALLVLFCEGLRWLCRKLFK